MGKKGETTYCFGRLNLIHAFYNKSKRDVLVQSITADNQYSFKQFEWGFFEISLYKDGSDEYVIGFLVKSSPSTTEETINKVDRKLTLTTIKDLAIAKSRFILHMNTGLIAYRPIPNKITESAFRNVFAKLIQKANDDFLVDAEIEVIAEEEDIFKSIQSLDKIVQIKVSLHPSNPSLRDRWAMIDQELKEMSADQYTAHYKSKKGLDISKGRPFAEISMASDGYGKATVTGYEGKNKRQISTEKRPIKIETIENITKEKEIPIEKSILDKFKEIIARVNS